MTDAAGNVTTYTYDTRGRKIAANDPDMGSWTYTYNVLDQLKTQTDAAGLITTVSYDLLGPHHAARRAGPDVDLDLRHRHQRHRQARLRRHQHRLLARPHLRRLGRPSQAQITIAGTTYTITTAYDSASRVSTITYPSGFAVSYAYNAFGYQTQLTNTATSQVYWTANAAMRRGA